MLWERKHPYRDTWIACKCIPPNVSNPARSRTLMYGAVVKLIVVWITCYDLVTNLPHSRRPSRKWNRRVGSGASECVNLASTRWINAIIGRTWGGENPFKACKAKQGPWLIHLANLRVMYECQGALVRLWGAGRWREPVQGGWVYGCKDSLQYRRTLRLGPLCSALAPAVAHYGGQYKWRQGRGMTKRCTESAEAGIALQMRREEPHAVCWAGGASLANISIPGAQSVPVGQRSNLVAAKAVEAILLKGKHMKLYTYILYCLGV